VTKEIPVTEPLTVAQYQARAREFAVYPEWAKVIYPLLGLCGEVAEVIEKFVAAIDPHYPEESPSELIAVLASVQSPCLRAGQLSKKLRDEFGFGNAGENTTAERAVAMAMGELRSNGLAAELGDCNWFLSNLFSDLGVSADAALVGNINKLTDRRNRNVLKGSGDSR
jgi:hypothetical protein